MKVRLPDSGSRRPGPGWAGRGGDSTDPQRGRLTTEHFDQVHGFVLRMVRNPTTADDITQETYAKALASRDQLREPSTRKTWLYSIAKNLALNYLTRNRETVDIEILPLASPRRTPEDEVVSDDVVERIWATAAHRLTPWRLRLLEMNVREDLSTPEIAKRLGISNNHAAVRVSEAKQMVREALEPELIAA